MVSLQTASDLKPQPPTSPSVSCHVDPKRKIRFGPKNTILPHKERDVSLGSDSRALFYITLIRDANSVLERYSGHTLEYEIVNLKILQKCVILSKRSSLKMLMAQASLTMSSNLTGVISLDWSQSCSSFDSRTPLI